MLYKQNISKFAALKIPQQYEDYYKIDERKLILEWDDAKVNESYQAIVLKYLDKLSGKDLQEQISNQMQKTYQKSTFYHKIQYLLGQRQQSIRMLYGCALVLQKYKKSQVHKQPNLQQSCDLIDHIRKTSMLICEAVWAMFQYYSFRPENSKTDTEGQYYLRLFKRFDEDMSFLKESIFKYYIPFSGVYDPLLIQSAKNLRRLYNDNRLVYDENVETLFNINASYLYRLLRAHQRMFHFVTLSRQLQNNQKMTPDYLVNFPARQTIEKPKKQIKAIYQELRKQNKLAQNQKGDIKSRVGSNSRKGSSKNDSQKIPRQPQVFRKSPSNALNTLNIQSRQRNIKGMNLSKNQNNKKYDRRAIVPCSSITIYNTINKSKNSFRREDKNSQVYSIQKQSSLPKNVVPINQGIRSEKEQIFYNKRTNTDPILHKDHNKQFHNEHQFESLRYTNKNTPPTTDYKQHICQLPASKRTIQSPLQNQARMPKKHSKSLQLPKLSSRLRQDHSHEQKEKEDCLCRQKYKNRQLRQSYAQAPEEIVDQRRKTLIRTISQKYKDLAQKQIRYELSLLGDKTYHHMKHKILNSRLKQNVKKNKLLTNKAKQKNVIEADEVGLH